MTLKTIAFGFAAVAALSAGAHAAILANWTFETTRPATAGPHLAEAGLFAATSQATGGNVGGTANVYSSPVGNGSAGSFSSNGWDVGDYYQFTTSTLGHQDVTLSWGATGSNTGPRDFRVAYSTDGTTFTNATSYVLTNDAWSSITFNPISVHTLDLSAVTALNNQATLYIRLIDDSTASINGGTVAAGGTSRVDDIVISGNLVPEPATLGLLAGMGVVGLRRRTTR